MTIDVNIFEMNSTFVEPIFMLINVVGFNENIEEKVKEDMELDVFENVESQFILKLRKICLIFYWGREILLLMLLSV